MHVDPLWLRQTFPDLTNLLPIGHGGQKLVFSATHPHDGPVVLKLIKPTQSFESVLREIVAVKEVKSPRVPAILDSGKVDTAVGPCLWIREQHIDGKTVRQLLLAGPIAERDVLLLGIQMLQALVCAESAKIVHRDVKPDNIIRDRAGDFWLLDFGLARHLTLESLTASAEVFGKLTWGYAPLEQCRNDKPNIDGRADLFALGVTMHECFFGRNAFRDGARDVLEILRRVRNLTLPPLRLSLVTASEVVDFISSLTQKRRDRRPPSVHYALNWMSAICQREGVES